MRPAMFIKPIQRSGCQSRATGCYHHLAVNNQPAAGIQQLPATGFALPQAGHSGLPVAAQAEGSGIQQHRRIKPSGLCEQYAIGLAVHGGLGLLCVRGSQAVGNDLMPAAAARVMGIQPAQYAGGVPGFGGISLSGIFDGVSQQ